MKRIYTALFGQLVIVLALCAGGADAQSPTRQLGLSATQDPPRTQQRIALVIGNGAYQHAGPLKNPANDARAMTAALKEVGFEVLSGVDVDAKEMRRLIREFGRRLRGTSSAGLFYYAGHGIQSRGRNYLVPVEADIEQEADLEDQAIELNYVLGVLDDAQNGLNVVILDACRNNPFARSFRSTQGGLAQVDAPTGTLIAYATAPGSVAADGEGSNGLYTSELLKQIRESGLNVETVFKRVRAAVQQVTKGKQVPWESSSLIGDFYFNVTINVNVGTAQPASTPVPKPVTVDPLAIELEYWNAIKDSNDPEEYRGYLAKYPNGQFADIARRRAAGRRGGNGTANRPPEPNPTPTPATPQTSPAPKPSPDSNNTKIANLGVVNGKAISLPKPAYPAIAVAARASGTVTVQVTIDESGRVISAQAISGHPLLQAAAVSAAQNAVFQPTFLSGQPVKVTGVIVYNFTLPQKKE